MGSSVEQEVTIVPIGGGGGKRERERDRDRDRGKQKYYLEFLANSCRFSSNTVLSNP